MVRDHFETFRAQAAHVRDGQGLPRFVEQEFRDFLNCRGGQDRLQLMLDGTAVLELRRRWTADNY